GRSKTDVLFKIFVSQDADAKHLINQEKECGDDHETPDDAPLLDERRKDEILRRFGKESKLRLRTLAVTLAPEPGGANGDLGLGDAVVNAQRILIGVKKTDKP